MNYSNLLNDNKHTLIIAEAGSNWKCGTFEEDLKRAKQLIQIAAKAGIDAVKFQTYKADTVYVKNAGKSEYLSKSGINEDINKIFADLSMPYKMIPELEKYCRQENVLFMSTPFSVKDVEQIDPYVQIHKVASYEINHIRLLQSLAKTKKPVILSTGASTYTDIDFAINLLNTDSKGDIALLQCTSKYPSSLESLNLFTIPKMKSKYNIPIGLSDHSTDPIIAPLMAIGLGATIIEKHFTLDKNLPGPDHFFAVEPEELELMVRSIRKADKAKGNGDKRVLEEEQELRNFATRAIQATKDISKGEVLKEGVNFDILRPGNKTRGLEPRFLEKISGKKAKTDIGVGEGIMEFE